jgi:hypothetical protein
VGGKEHRQGAEFALHGVEHHTESLERDSAEQSAVLLFAEDDRSSTLTAIEPPQHVADFACNFGAILEGKGALGVWPDAEFAEQGRRNDGINGSGVHEEAEFNHPLRSCGVGNVQFDVSQAHKQRRDSSVISTKKCVK